MTVDSVAALREEIWDAGFRPVPVVNCDRACTSPGKKPGGPDGGREWEKRARQDPPVALRWRDPLELNTGILCDGLRPVDVDVEDATIAARIRATAVFMLGEAPMRVRDNSARCLLLYRAAEGEPHKRKLEGQHGKVEILGLGNQFVAYGLHPSGSQLRWLNDEPRNTLRNSLPAVTEQQIDAFLAEVGNLLGQATETHSTAPHETAADVRALIEEIKDAGAADVTSAADLPQPIRDALDAAIAKSDRLAARWNGDVADLQASGRDASRSGRDMSLAAMLKGAGLSDTAAAVGLLAFEHGAAHDVAKHPTQWTRLRYVARTALRSSIANLSPDQPAPLSGLVFDEETGEILSGPPKVDFGADEADGEPEPEAQQQGQPKQNKRQLRIMTIAEVEAMPPPEWLIDGLIPARGLVVPYGPPKAGKTFIVLNWALHIAAGLEWNGKAVRKGAVVYVVGEGIGGFSTRLAVARAYMQIGTDIPFFVVPRAVNFREDKEVVELVRLIRHAVPAGMPISLVVLDTLARSMPGVDENSAQDVGLVIARCDAVKEELDATVMPVHHTGKDVERGMRGSNAITGAVDASFLIQAAEDGRVRVTNDNQKDGEPAGPMVFGMEKVSVGFKSSLVPVIEERGQPGRPRDPNAPDEKEILTRVVIAMAGCREAPLRRLTELMFGQAGGRNQTELSALLPASESHAVELRLGAKRHWLWKRIAGEQKNAPIYVMQREEDGDDR